MYKGAELKKRREEKGMSLMDVVKQLKKKHERTVSKQTIHIYEIEKVRSINVELLHEIYDVLGMDRTELPPLDKRIGGEAKREISRLEAKVRELEHKNAELLEKYAKSLESRVESIETNKGKLGMA